MNVRIRKPCWVFGFGSLVWVPGFAYADAVPARLIGWHRRFSLVSHQSWGSLENPGLVAALHRGGACAGFAFRLHSHNDHEVIRYLRERERAYRWVEVPVMVRGKSVRAVTFAFAEGHPRAAGPLSYAAKLQHLKQGVGTKGTSTAYVLNLGYALRRQGVTIDVELNRLSQDLGYGWLLAKQQPAPAHWQGPAAGDGV